MKRILTGTRVRIPLLLLLIFIAGISVHAEARTGTQSRTIINAERAPFFFTVLAPDHTIVPQSEGSIAATLRRNQWELRSIAPEGMVPITHEAGILVGYFGGSASGLMHRPVVHFLSAGATPVTIDRDSIERVGGIALRLAPWELPALPDPIVLDGRDGDWQEISPMHSFSTMNTPPRLEETLQGREITLDETRFWRAGGTLIRELYLTEGRNNWYLAIRTDGPILNNTGFHLRPHPELEIAILVDGRTGPAVYRWSDGTVDWAGQYVLNSAFLEMAIDKHAVPTVVTDYLTRIAPESSQIDIATSHRTPSRAERFTLGSFSIQNPVHE